MFRVVLSVDKGFVLTFFQGSEIKNVKGACIINYFP